MGSIRGDGSDILMVNGHQVRYQGIGSIRPDITTAQAVQSTANDGYQKYFLESPDHQNRIVVWGDKLDFSFEHRESVPQVTVDGQPYVMAAHDDEATSVMTGFIRGVGHGIASAADATLGSAKGIIGSIAAVGAVGLAGGTTLALVRGVGADAIAGTATGLAVPALEVVGSAILLGTVVAGVAGGIKGAIDASERHADSAALADVIIPGAGPVPDPNPSVPGQLVVNPGQSGTPSNPTPTPSPSGNLMHYPFHPGNAVASKLMAALAQVQAGKR